MLPAMSKVIAYGTEKQAYFNLFMESCHRFGIEPVILGWGDTWVGTSQKLYAICDYIKDLPDDEIVLSVDPFDVIFLSGLDEVEAKFRQTGASFLCGALKLQFFNALVYDHEFNRTPWPTPSTPTGYNYLNAGTWISTAGYAYRLLKDLIDTGQFVFNDIDQEIFTALYIWDSDRVDIDWKCQVFYNLLFSDFLTRRPDLTDLQYRDGRIRNRATGSIPPVLHASGNVIMKEIALSLGYEPGLTIPEKDMKNYMKKAVFHLGKILKYSITNKSRLAGSGQVEQAQIMNQPGEIV